MVCLRETRPSVDPGAVTLFRRPSSDPDAVDVFARLAGYEATSTDGLNGRYASGYTLESIASASAVGDVDIPGHLAAPRDVPEERRGAARVDLHLPVRTKSRADDDWQVGRTVDASMTGLCLQMAHPPDETHLDVEIDSPETITAWARVVGVTLVEAGVFRWRLRLVSYDASYPILINRLDPLATPEDLPISIHGPGHTGSPVSDDGSWGELLEHATA